MASGSFNLTKTSETSSYITFKCSWSSVANASTNSSVVTVTLTASKSSSSTADTYGKYDASITVDGKVTNKGLTSFRLSPNETITLISNAQFTVAHNSNGTKSTTIRANVGGDVMGGSGSATITLDPISVTPSSISNFRISAGYGNYVGLGDTINISWSKPSGTVTGYELQYSRGNSGWKAWKTVTGTSVTDSFTATDIGVNGAGCAVKYRIRALNGSNASGWTVSNTLYITGGMDLKVANAWKTGSVWIKVNGVWKRAKRIWRNVNGTWKYSI